MLLIRCLFVAIWVLVCQHVAAQSISKSSYTPIVTANNNLPTSRDFKGANPPASLSDGGISNTKMLSYRFGGSTALENLKFFFPPGTIGFTANFLPYRDPGEAKAVMQMFNPPVHAASYSTAVLANSVENSGGPNGQMFDETILKNLYSGKEVYFYGYPLAGVMNISQGGVALNTPTSNGGYVYANFQYPGGALGSSQWIITVDKTCYEKWYATAVWDANGNPSEDTVHVCSEPVALTDINLVSTANGYTIVPVPSAAGLGTCSVSNNLVSVDGNAITLTPGNNNLSSTTQVTVICSGVVAGTTPVSKEFSIEPLPQLNFDMHSLTQGSGTAVKVTKAGVTISTCTFDSNEYLEWFPSSATIKFKVGATVPTLTQTKTVKVTCDGFRVETLTLIPAPVGVLFPMHDNEAGSGVAPTPVIRDEKKIMLRWREANASGVVSYSALDGKYPNYPTSTSNTKFVCTEVDGTDMEVNPKRLLFVGATDTTLPMLELTSEASAAVIQTRVLCYVQGKEAGGQVFEESKKRLVLNINNGKWELAVPTATNPVLDVSGSTGNAKLQLYIPQASVATADVPVVIQLYLSDNTELAPGGAFVTPSGLKMWDGNLNESEFINTTVRASAATRVIDVDMLMSKKLYADFEYKIKAKVWYRNSQLWQSGWLELTKPSTEWDPRR